MDYSPEGSIESMSARGAFGKVRELVNEHAAQSVLEKELQSLYSVGNTSVRSALRTANEALVAYGYEPVVYEVSQG